MAQAKHLEEFLSTVRGVHGTGGGTKETSYYTALNNLLDGVGHHRRLPGHQEVAELPRAARAGPRVNHGRDHGSHRHGPSPRRAGPAATEAG